ncbi:hypothetical protein C8J56DRAFT_1159620 [Mycena floridula]|nr:hypothetical protein C8J56DRAFT_1159620 [Mycena floridula]
MKETRIRIPAQLTKSSNLLARNIEKAVERVIPSDRFQAMMSVVRAHLKAQDDYTSEREFINNHMPKILKQFPELDRFEDHWPLKLYRKVHRTNRMNLHRRSHSTVRRPQAAEDVRREDVQQQEDSFESSQQVTESDTDVATTRPISRSVLFIGRPPPSLAGKSITVRTCDEPPQPPSFTPMIPKKPEMYPEICVACGFKPRITSLYSVVLHSIVTLANMNEYSQANIDILAAAGIRHDLHLRRLLEMEKADRREFLHKLTFLGLSELFIYSLVQILDETSTEICKPSIIPKPLSVEISWLSDLRCTDRTLVERARIPRDTLYGHLAAIVMTYEKVFGAFVPTDQRVDPAKKKVFLQKVCDAVPRFRSYEELWLVEVLLARLLKQSPSDWEDATNRAYASEIMFAGHPIPLLFKATVMQSLHSCDALLTQSLIDFPPHKLATHFRSLNIPELIPAAIQLGLHSDRALFEKVATYTQEDLNSFLDEQRSVHITPFHKSLLAIAFRKASNLK